MSPKSTFVKKDICFAQNRRFFIAFCFLFQKLFHRHRSHQTSGRNVIQKNVGMQQDIANKLPKNRL